MDDYVIDKPELLFEQLNSLHNGYIYRGHASSKWKLESSLERLLGDSFNAENAEKYETYSCDKFSPKFHLYDNENISPSSKLAWLSIMQHYGVPTRLLDFTESPYVALYFALEAYDYRSKEDIAIFALNYNDFMEKSLDYIRKVDRAFVHTQQSINGHQDKLFDEVVDNRSYEIAWVTEPTRMNKRLDRQAGCFLISGKKGLRIESLLSSPIYHDCDFRKYIIKMEIVACIFALLRKMNITSKSIYGDLNGLARGIKMEMQMYSL